ncbi:hypothetical protein V1291_004786 [Nitrobacteraceae bacterium AZCC 1564]
MLEAFKILCFALGWTYALLIAGAQFSCSIIPSIGHQCNGPEADVWMVPFFLAPIGLPLLIASIVMSIMKVIRRPRGSSQPDASADA